MSREEYMKQLAYLLQDIAENEKAEALHYYEDYFEEAGMGEEQNVIDRLGTPEKLAAIIKEGLSEPDTGDQGERFRTKRNDLSERLKNPRNPGNMIVIILICICVIPIILPIFGKILGVIVSVIAALFSLVGIFFVVAFAAMAGGCVLIGLGIVKMLILPGLGFLLAGIGLLLIAVGILIFWAGSRLVKKVTSWCRLGITALRRKIFSRRGLAA